MKKIKITNDNALAILYDVEMEMDAQPKFNRTRVLECKNSLDLTLSFTFCNWNKIIMYLDFSDKLMQDYRQKFLSLN